MPDPTTDPTTAPTFGERGQTTAEYALVLIAAATIAMLIVAWAANTGAISSFFDEVIDRVTSMLP